MLFLYCFFIRSIDQSINYGNNIVEIHTTEDDPYIRIEIPQIDYDPVENFKVPLNYCLIIFNNNEFIDENNNSINKINIRPRNEKYFILQAISPKVSNITYTLFDVDVPNPTIIFNSNSSQYQFPNFQNQTSLYLVSESLYNYRLDTGNSTVNVSFAYKLLTNYKTSGIADFQTTFVRITIGDNSNITICNTYSWEKLSYSCDIYNTGDWTASEEYSEITTYYIRFTGEVRLYLEFSNYTFEFQPVNEINNHIAFFMTKDILQTETDDSFPPYIINPKSVFGKVPIVQKILTIYFMEASTTENLAILTNYNSSFYLNPDTKPGKYNILNLFSEEQTSPLTMAECSTGITYKQIFPQLRHQFDDEITDSYFSYKILALEVEIKDNFNGIIGFYNNPSLEVPESDIYGIFEINFENYGFGIVSPRELVINVTNVPFYLGVNSSKFMRLVFLRNQKSAIDKTGKNYEIINDIDGISRITTTGPLPITIGLIPNCSELRLNTLPVGNYTLFGKSKSNVTYCYLSSSKLYTAFDTSVSKKIYLNYYLYNSTDLTAFTLKNDILTVLDSRYITYRGFGMIFKWEEQNRIKSTLGFNYLGPLPSTSLNDTFYNNSIYTVLTLADRSDKNPVNPFETKNIYWAVIVTIIVVVVVSLSFALFKSIFKDKPKEGKSQSENVETTLI